MDFSWAFLSLASATVVVAYWIYAKVNIYLRQRRISNKYGCKKLRRAPQKEPFLALDHFFSLTKAAQENRYLEYIEKWFKQVGHTFGINLMGDDMIFTNEPKNIQAILVTNFPNFEIGQRRRDNSRELLGVGVFNADGATWEHGRALVRPNFTRKQVSDLPLFEKHVQVMMAGLPSDGTPVDIQEWAFRFVSET
jgi:cytochrome P450